MNRLLKWATTPRPELDPSQGLPGYVLSPGFTWNPLKKFRNEPCPCGSGRKSKRCHGVSETLPIEDAMAVLKYMEAKRSRDGENDA